LQVTARDTDIVCGDNKLDLHIWILYDPCSNRVHGMAVGVWLKSSPLPIVTDNVDQVMRS
jgi:hypothetical protein